MWLKKYDIFDNNYLQTSCANISRAFKLASRKICNVIVEASFLLSEVLDRTPQHTDHWFWPNERHSCFLPQKYNYYLKICLIAINVSTIFIIDVHYQRIQIAWNRRNTSLTNRYREVRLVSRVKNQNEEIVWTNVHKYTRRVRISESQQKLN